MENHANHTGHVHVEKWFCRIIHPDWLRRLYQKPGKILAGLVRPGMVVADIGCGSGFYAVELARLVGESGQVLAVDFQSRMLDMAKEKAGRAGVLNRIRFIQCDQDDLKLSDAVDFVLTMWVVHEVSDRDRFFKQVQDSLKPGGRYLLAEPTFRVKKQEFKAICDEAERAGLAKIAEPRVGLSLAALFATADARREQADTE
jgi:ubiquinone/menaquinone biosynthesis C-methylase UbiE